MNFRPTLSQQMFLPSSFVLLCLFPLLFANCAKQPSGRSNTVNEAVVVTDQTTNPLSGTSVVSAGRSLYAVHCMMCHGETGNGAGAAGNAIAIKPADLSASQAILSDGKLFLIIKDGVRKAGKPTMPPARNISDQEIWQIVAYVRTFSK